MSELKRTVLVNYRFLVADSSTTTKAVKVKPCFIQASTLELISTVCFCIIVGILLAAAQKLNNFGTEWDWKPAEQWRTWCTACISNICKCSRPGFSVQFENANIFLMTTSFDFLNHYFLSVIYPRPFPLIGRTFYCMFPSEPLAQAVAIKKITYFTSLIMHFIWAKLMLLVTVLQHLIKEIPSSQPPLSKDGAPLRVSRFEEIPEATKKKTKKK